MCIRDRYWRLINEFGKRTGVHVVLNTSFNNRVEPIVDSVDDAIQCFLTTGLDALVIDDFVLRKIGDPKDHFSRLRMRRSALTRIRSESSWSEGSENVRTDLVYGSATRPFAVTPVMGQLYRSADGARSVADVLQRTSGATPEDVVELWERRFVRMSPA